MPSAARHAPRRQVVVIAVALCLWSLHPVAAVWALVLAYGVAWVALNVVLALRPKLADPSLGRAQAFAVLALLVAAPVAILARHGRDLLDEESLLGFGENVSDHLRLERTPAIAPPVVGTDEPQIFYV